MLREEVMNKCGIITFHRTANFGSCLQAYALHKAVADLGYPCDLIDYRCPAVEDREGIGKRRSRTVKGFLQNMIYGPVRKRKSRNLLSFLERNASFSEGYTPQTIRQANKVYDKFLVGSDIVWGVDITNSDYNYFLDFVEQPEKKYAFSSSVGYHSTRQVDPKIPALLKSFQRIAVREQQAVDWVRQLSGKEASWVCDPTMLLTAQQWDALVQPKQNKSDYVFVYFTDPDGKCMRDAKAYAAANGLKVCTISYDIKPLKEIRKSRATSLREFLGLIKNAQFVFTASYHGMLFAMYYQKAFVFYTRDHSDRVLSLAQRLGVEDRCADKMDIGNYRPIDYQKVEEKLRTFREESISVLTEMLQA